MKLTIPQVGSDEAQAVARVLESGNLTQGAETERFESLVGRFVGTDFAFATSSATTGLHLVLDAFGVQPGDEVIMPAFSFPATANVAVQLGAVPVFVDIDIETFNIDPALIPGVTSPRSAAIMPVHAFGLPADMPTINSLASQHEIPVVEDAACALGASIHGRSAGAWGTAGVFSFHPRKIITTGEGGMVTTDDQALAERLRVLRSHGGVRGDLFMEFVSPGYNYRLSDVHAAIGVAQMARLDKIAAQRVELASRLSSLLADVAGVRTPVCPSDYAHSYQSYVVILDDSIDRDRIILEMRKREVETTLGTYGMHLQPFFQERYGYRAEMFPNATRAHFQALTLPLYPGMTQSDLDLVASSLRDCLANA